LQQVADNPCTSTRRISGQLGVGHMTVWRVLNGHGYKAFHRTKVQKLNQHDYPLRTEFCTRYNQECQENPQFSSLVLYTDEATFNESGIFNSKNNIYWAVENPNSSYETGRQEKFKVNVWAGIVGDHLIGPYILPERLDAHNYVVFLRDVPPELLEDVPIEIRRNM